MIIINDLHTGVTRQAGTTPDSQARLRDYVQGELKQLVSRAAGKHLVIVGDLFDAFEVLTRDVIEAHITLCRHLESGGDLTLGSGNHDYSAKAERVSSFHLLAHMLQAQYPDRVRVIDHLTGMSQVEGGVWMIPHMLSQDLFNVEIKRATQATEGGYLLLHANCMSPFAEHSDHSLNVSEDQVDALIAAGWTLVFAHEHQPTQYRDGRVLIIGNQIPTSVADCLGPVEKRYAQIVDGKLEWIKWLEVPQVFAEVDWHELDAPIERKFIRVTGDCAADQAAEMIQAVSKLRQKNPAFVITNAVKVEGVAQMDGLAEMTAEEIGKFDVVAALMSMLDPREQATVKELLS